MNWECLGVSVSAVEYIPTHWLVLEAQMPLGWDEINSEVVYIPGLPIGSGWETGSLPEITFLLGSSPLLSLIPLLVSPGSTSLATRHFIETLAESLILGELELKQVCFREHEPKGALPKSCSLPLWATVYSLSSDVSILNAYSPWLETSSLNIERGPQGVSVMDGWVWWGPDLS